MPANGKEIVRTYDRYLQRDINFRQAWQTLADFIQPTRTNIIRERQAGDKQTIELFDSTAPSAADLLASFLYGEIINPATDWFRLKMRDDDLNENDEVKEWLDDDRKRMLKALNASNFYEQGFETFVDYSGFGTGNLLGEELPVKNEPRQDLGFRGLRFVTTQIGHYVADEDHNQRVDRVYRSYKLTAFAAAAAFGVNNLPDKVRQSLEKEPEKQFEFIHAVYPREERGFGAKGFPWASMYVEKETHHLCKESGYEEFPFLVPRWQKTPGEIYGRSPGFSALPDIRSLNKAKELELDALAMAIRPPIGMAHGSVIGNVRLVPAGLNVFDTHGRPIKDVFQPLEMGTKWDITNVKEEQIRESINQLFYVQIIRDLLRVDRPEKTAFEFAKKLELMNKLLGPVWGRMQAEFLNPLIDRVFAIMLRRGALQTPPDVLLETGADIDVEYEGPLAKAQRGQDAEAILMTANDALIIAQAKQALEAVGVYSFDADEALRQLAEVRGAPGKVLRSQEQAEAIAQARIQAMEEANQKEDAMALAEGAGKAAPAIKLLQGGKAA